MNLDLIWKLWGGAKERGRPGRSKINRVAMFMDDEDALRAVRFVRDFEGKLNTSKSTKVLFLYEEAGRKVLELAEISNVDRGDAMDYRGRGDRDRRVPRGH